jgi:hypothetical protein
MRFVRGHCDTLTAIFTHMATGARMQMPGIVGIVAEADTEVGSLFTRFCAGDFLTQFHQLMGSDVEGASTGADGNMTT